MALPPEKPQIIEFERLSLWANHPELPNIRCRMGFAMRLGYPRVFVYFNDPSKKGFDNMVTGAMDPTSFQIVVNYLRLAADSQPGWKRKIECLRPEWKDGRPVPGTLQLDSELWIGKNNQGCVWMSLIAKNKPKVVFEIKLSEYHRVYKEDGTPATEAEMSVECAKALATDLSEVMCQWIRPGERLMEDAPIDAGVSGKLPVDPDNAIKQDFASDFDF